MDDDRETISFVFKDWEQIHPLPLQSSSFQAHACSEGEARERPPSMGWEVVLRQETLYADDYSIFPPRDHEGLDISFHGEQRQGRQEQEVAEEEPELSTPRPSDSRLRVTGCVLKQLRFGFEFLCSKNFRIVSSVCSRVLRRVTIWSFPSATGVAAALLLSLLYVSVRWWRRRIQLGKLDRLILLVREQDQKISRLSQQIEVITAHHRAPTLRKAD
ncbi:hypothetical protein NE237_020656 [Protea cynaroides]|uniref:Uncharacterized protein n=1 Tax=Protea cynaroides TaxID=273540 RepID=A0A9Q0H8U1_9MAGN|nr:hypothetical protein NE237_020656 [Protea cynaroides]